MVKAVVNSTGRVGIAEFGGSAKQIGSRAQHAVKGGQFQAGWTAQVRNRIIQEARMSSC